MFKFSKKSLKRLEGVNPLLIAILVDVIQISPYDFGIPQFGGMRSPKIQFLLFKDHKTKKDGYKKKSKHQTGQAVDIYIYKDGKASWNIDMLTTVANHIISVAKDKYNTEIRWGGDWDRDKIRVDKDPDEWFLDGGHFELIE